MSPLVERNLAALLDEAQRPLVRESTVLAARPVLGRMRFIVHATRARPVRGLRIEVLDPAFSGRLDFRLNPGGGQVRIASAGPIQADIRLYRSPSLEIGAGTTMNGVRLVCDDADVTIGEDGLWSDMIVVQSNDQHGLVDLATLSIVNDARRRIEIGDHVWIGRGAMLMPGSAAGEGAVLGARSLLTARMPPATLFAGTPAREIRRGVSWSRSALGIAPGERARLERLAGEVGIRAGSPPPSG